ncbi:hypothetical protein RPE78_04875 [Thioclava litoralis]|uniref:MORN repeat variant n=1 Tax=Thioclava litoralis TaxID=3076557 RepID=A0ABZ1E1R2_9RHOB|nr:hypothetical protein RPE78_04875 [Thioclava sp. FTW29]
MLFDVQAALTDILANPPCDTRDICDVPSPMSQKSQVSQGVAFRNQGKSKHGYSPVFPNLGEEEVGFIKGGRIPEGRKSGDCHKHGKGVNGEPVTWTGRVVSFEEWGRLSAWDRHGPDGRQFNGITRQWEYPEGEL